MTTNQANTNRNTTHKQPAQVTKNNHTPNLKANPFEFKNAKKIAESLKESAEQSHRIKSSPFRSAMSMLTFYINRMGKNLDADQKKILEQAKVEIRKLYGRKFVKR